MKKIKINVRGIFELFGIYLIFVSVGFVTLVCLYGIFLLCNFIVTKDVSNIISFWSMRPRTIMIISTIIGGCLFILAGTYGKLDVRDFIIKDRKSLTNKNKR